MWPFDGTQGPEQGQGGSPSWDDLIDLSPDERTNAIQQRRSYYDNYQQPNNDSWITQLGGYLGVLPPSQQYGYGQGLMERGTRAVMDPMMGAAESMASVPRYGYNALASLFQRYNQPSHDAITQASPRTWEW